MLSTLPELGFALGMSVLPPFVTPGVFISVLSTLPGFGLALGMSVLPAPWT